MDTLGNPIESTLDLLTVALIRADVNADLISDPTPIDTMTVTDDDGEIRIALSVDDRGCEWVEIWTEGSQSSSPSSDLDGAVTDILHRLGRDVKP